MTQTVRLTVAQAVVKFLANQYTERDGAEQKLFAGCFGIFGHGNVAGIGQALLQAEVQTLDGVAEAPDLPYVLVRNEQGAVHAAAAYAKTKNRLQTWVVTSSIGPGALNMVTGAALATTNRLPVLLLPSDIFATRYPDPVLQQLEDPPPGSRSQTPRPARVRSTSTTHLVIVIGTRYSDFTTASHTVFANPDVRFLNVNVMAFDAAKHSAEMLVSDAKAALEALTGELTGWATDEAYQARAGELDAEWQKVVDTCYAPHDQPLPAQTEVFGALNELMGDYDVVINAAGSMPGDLQALWRARTPEQYHLEYAFSCMGYEIPAAMGVKLAVGDDHEVVAIVGDGTYQMLPMEIATMAQEGIKVILVLLQNHGFASIGALSESRGSQRFGTRYKTRSTSGRLDGADVPFDLAANAASWGADVLKCNGMAEFRENYAKAVANDRTTVLYIETNLYGPNPPGSAWWDVPVSQTSELESTQKAYGEYVAEKAAQRHYL